MAVNPAEGTSNMQEAAAQIEGILGGDEEVVEETVEETESDEEVEESTEDQPEEESEDDDEADEDDEPEEEVEETDEEISTLEELAEATGRSPEELLESMTTTVKVDGETSEVSLSELKAGYQKDRDYRQKTEALNREREQWDQERANYAQSVEQQHQIAAYVLNQQEQALRETLNSQEMQQLEQQDPNKFLMQERRVRNELERLQQTKQQAAQELSRFQQAQQQEQYQKLQETLQREKEALNRELPNLDNGKLTEYLSNNLGFSPDEIGQVYDHRLVKMAEKARLYDEQVSKAETTTKRVKKAPKAPRPTKGNSPAKVKRSELSKVKGRLKKSGHVRDAAQYLLESGQV